MAELRVARVHATGTGTLQIADGRDKLNNASTPTDAYEMQDNGTMSFDPTRGPRICAPSRLVREILHIAHNSQRHYGDRMAYERISRKY